MTNIKIISLPQPYVISINENKIDNLRLEKDYKFSIKFGNVSHKFKINKGFIYNGMSAPRITRFLFGFERRGLHDPATLIHDFAYKYGYFLKDDNSKVYIKRKKADRILEKCFNFLSIKSWHTRLVYLGVRGFGSRNYRRD